MTKNDFGRTVAVLLCTLVMSTTCVIGAIGPAQAVGGGQTVVHARQVA